MSKLNYADQLTVLPMSDHSLENAHQTAILPYVI